MEAFYTRRHGLPCQSDRGFVPRYNGHITFMSNDPTIHHQVILAEGRPADVPSTVNQLSFLVKSLDELRAMYRRVVARKVSRTCCRATTAMPGRSISTIPEGNNLRGLPRLPVPRAPALRRVSRLSICRNDEILATHGKLCAAQTEGFLPRAEWSAKMAAARETRPSRSVPRRAAPRSP